MKVGEDVRSICGKCGDTWHVVIALVEGRAAKVECGDCHARHRYRIPGGAGATRRTARKTGTRKSASVGEVVEPDLSKQIRPFRTTETFEVGDRVAHPTLGEGVVQALTGPTKIEVLFGAQRRVLVHSRK